VQYTRKKNPLQEVKDFCAKNFFEGGNLVPELGDKGNGTPEQKKDIIKNDK